MLTPLRKVLNCNSHVKSPFLNEILKSLTCYFIFRVLFLFKNKKISTYAVTSLVEGGKAFEAKTKIEFLILKH